MEHLVLVDGIGLSKDQALREISAQMLAIEQKNMAYNKATNFGLNPNGQEGYIVHLLNEWDHLKIRMQRLKDLK